MSERYFETQDLRVEIDTGDATLGAHTDRRLYYIHTDEDGVAAAPAFKVGLVTETQVMYADLDPLEVGTYRVWAESVNASSQKCVSPAFLVPVEARGTVRLG